MYKHGEQYNLVSSSKGDYNGEKREKALPESPEKVAPEDCEGEPSKRLRVFYIA